MKITTKTLAFAMIGACSASAATIAWDPVVVNTTAAHIITDGSLHVASNSADTDDATINGVLFTAEAAGPLANNANGTFFTASNAGNFTTGDAGLDILLDSHSYLGGGGANFDITGLTPGNTYQIQIIAVGDTRTCCSAREQQFGDGVGALSGVLTRNDPASVVGTFVADAAIQNIIVEGAADPGLSGYQVRDVTIPEPGSALLSLVGLFGLAARRRR